MGVFLGVIASVVGMLMLCGLSCLISRLWHPYLWVGTARPTTDQIILAHAKTVELDADWTTVRKMEREVYGVHYHRADGTTSELGWEPVVDDAPEAEKVRLRTEAEGPCHCNYCHGRVGVHGADAIALHKAWVEVAIKGRPDLILTGSLVEGTCTRPVTEYMQLSDGNWMEVASCIETVRY